MSTISKFGFGTTAFMYVMFSFGNHSWDPMTWNSIATYWFGCLSATGWMTGLLVVGLGIDEEIKYNKNRKKSSYDDVFGKH